MASFAGTIWQDFSSALVSGLPWTIERAAIISTLLKKADRLISVSHEPQLIPIRFRGFGKRCGYSHLPSSDPWPYRMTLVETIFLASFCFILTAVRLVLYCLRAINLPRYFRWVVPLSLDVENHIICCLCEIEHPVLLFNNDTKSQSENSSLSAGFAQFIPRVEEIGQELRQLEGMSRSLPFQRDLATEVRLLRESYDSIRSTIFGEATDNQPVQTEYNVELPRARPLSLVLEETDLKYYNNNGVATPRHDLIGFTVAPSSESNSVTSSLTPVSDTSVNRFVAPASPSRAPNLTEENLAEHDAEVSESPTSDTVKLTADTGIMADASRSHYPVFSDSPQEYPASPTTSSSKAVLFGSPREIDDADSEVLEPFPDLELGPVSEIKRTSSPIQAHEVELTSSPLENPSEISYQQTRLSTIMEDSDVETDDAVADSLELTVPKDSSAGSPDSLPALISMLQDSWNFDNTAALRAEEALTDTVANVMQANAESGIALFPPTIQQSITGADLESPPSPYPHYEIQEAASTQVGSDVNSRHETADLSSPKGSVDEIFSEHKSLPEEVELIEQLELALNSRDSSASYSQTKEDGPAPEAFNALSEIGSSPLEPVRSLETTLELRTYKARSSPTPLREDSVAHLDVSPKEDSVLSPIRQRSKLPRKVHRAKSLTRRTPIFNSVKPFGGNIIIRDSPSPEKSLLAPGVFTFDKGKNVLYAEPESMGNSSFSSPRTPTIRVSPSRGKGSKSRDRTHPPIFVRPAQGAKIPKDEGIEPFPDLKPLPLEPSTSLNTPRVPRMELYESSLMLPTDGDDHWDVD